MYPRSFHKLATALICFLAFSFSVHAQTTPGFLASPQVAELGQPIKVLAADVNNDNLADLITYESNSSGSNLVLYLNKGDGTFGAPISIMQANGIADFAIGDFNQDGNLDIAVLVSTGPFNATGTAAVTVFLGNGQGSFGGAQTFQAGSLASSIAAGDFNNDGRMDLAVLSTFAKTVTILTNTGASFTVGSFTVPTNFDTSNPGFAPDLLTSLIAGDFNGDGKMDLLYQDSCGSTCDVSEENYYLLTNTGSGFIATHLTLASTGAGPLHTLDLDGDGRSDFFFSYAGCHTPCNGVVVAYSNGDGTFQALDAFNADTDINGGPPSDVIAGDFNNDGVMDIAAAVGSGFIVNPGLDIYIGKGGRTGFNSPVHFDSPNGVTAGPFRIAAGFVNAGGQPDILVAEVAGDFIPFMNISGTANDPCVYPLQGGINFCLPAAGGTVTSPVHFVGSFHAPTQPANRIELWIDGKKQFQVFNDRIDTSVALGIGVHTAALVGVNGTGLIVKTADRSFTVQAACPVPKTATVSICSPAAGAGVGSPVHVTAAAAAPAGRTISAMRIYIDNMAQMTVSGTTITDDITLASGSHLLAVVAWDNTGVAEKTTETFTVTGGGTAGPCLPTSPGVKICLPAANASVTSPVEVAAGAVPTALKITAIRVYVDNVAAFFSSNSGTANSFSIDPKLTMAVGTRHLVIVAYQNNGTALTVSETITVH
jgi:hypothetical protein